MSGSDLKKADAEAEGAGGGGDGDAGADAEAEGAGGDGDGDAGADAEGAGADAARPRRKAPGLAQREALEKTRVSWGYPAFARDFPYDEELAKLVAAFAAGDYATVRKGAPALAATTDDADVKRAAELLRSRIEPDPTARMFFVLTAALMVFLMVWWATHDGPQHHAPAPAKLPPTVEFVK